MQSSSGASNIGKTAKVHVQKQYWWNLYYILHELDSVTGIKGQRPLLVDAQLVAVLASPAMMVGSDIDFVIRVGGFVYDIGIGKRGALNNHR